MTWPWSARRLAPTASVDLAPLCADCGHVEDDHNGYGGMCDGLGGNSGREVCPCQQFIPPQSAVPHPSPTPRSPSDE